MRERITESLDGYKKGFVLGLTLAEVGLLLIFTLLLLIGIDESKNKKIPHTQYNELLSQRDLLAQITGSRNVSTKEEIDDFIELVRQSVELLDAGGDELLAELKKERDKALELQRQLINRANPEQKQTVEQLLAQTKENSRMVTNLKGQQAQMRKLLEQAGNGLVFPSCWTTADGTIQYLYDIELTSNGIRAKEIEHSDRSIDRLNLPIHEFSPHIPLVRADFVAKTRDLFEWSVANECRFYVVVHDNTGPSEKQIYKNSMKSVEANFYKYESNKRADF